MYEERPDLPQSAEEQAQLDGNQTATEAGCKPPITEEAIQAAMAEQLKQAQAISREAQLKAWQQFKQEHPIAARKARQQAEAEARRFTRVNLMFGNLTLAGRE